VSGAVGGGSPVRGIFFAAEESLAADFFFLFHHVVYIRLDLFC
jgi:hypothetical protein